MLEAALREIADIVGPRHVLTAAADRAPFEIDWTRRFAGTTPAVVQPGDTDEVAAVLAVCRRDGLAVVPQGGNTGMVGGSVPLAGEVVLSLRRLHGVGTVDTEARQVTASAGATVGDVQRAAAGAGLRYAVDFGARDSATVGGSIATNAGGINVFRHGSTRQQVVGIEAVLGTGHRVSRLQGLVKDNTGYHLPSVLCGSEGTLGIVTAARLQLVTAHAHRVVAMIGFESVAAAVAAVATWRSSLDALEAAELMLPDGLDLVREAYGLPAPLQQRWPAVVLIEASDHDDPTPTVAAAVAAVAAVGEVAVAADPARRAALWRYREDHTAAISTRGVPHKFDVTVPVGAVAELVAAAPGWVAEVEPDASTWQFGHVGDGNIHINVTGVAGAGDALDEHVYTLVTRLGGSISAEHGIGTAKARWLHLTRSADEIAVMRSVKRALDPDGILNPHVLLPAWG